MGRVLWGGLMAAVAAATWAEEPPSPEEMWRVIQEQQRTIEALERKLEVTEDKLVGTERKVAESDEKIEAASEAIEQAGTGTAASWAERTSVGGYGELHYNNLENEGTGDDLDQVDFHRFVLYFGHRFTDRIRFFSELELEHALTLDTDDGSGAGEVELEQAWIQFDYSDQHGLRAGLDVLPIGIINPTHEPPTFYGVERNRVETEIIPTTWWEAGLGFNGEIAPGWNYDLVLHSGLDVPTTGGSRWRVRSGRRKVSEAPADNGAMTGRLRYTGYPGLEVGVSGQYQDDITQDTADISAYLAEAHIDFKHSSGLGLRALYVHWGMDGGDPLSGPVPGPETVDADSLDGFYIEPAYRFPLPRPLWGELGLFARYSRWDERNQLPGADFRFIPFDEITVGFNYWPHPDVVVKFDYQNQDADGQARDVFDGFNLGLGYQF